MKKRIFAVAMALCLLAGTSTFAQRPKRDQKDRPTAEQIAQRRTETMTEQLKLNEVQQKQMYELNLQQAQLRHDQSQQMRDAYKARMEKMKTILTPAQFEQWKQANEQMRQTQKGPQCRRDSCRRGTNKPCPRR